MAQATDRCAFGFSGSVADVGFTLASNLGNGICPGFPRCLGYARCQRSNSSGALWLIPYLVRQADGPRPPNLGFARSQLHRRRLDLQEVVQDFRGLKSTMCGRVSHTARILPTFVSLISTTWREFQARRRASSTTFHRYAGNGVHVTANWRAATRYLSGRARRQDRGSADLHRCPSARSW